MDYEKILDEFIERERAKVRAGSGDDMAYEQDIINYVNKQRKFWIIAIKEFMNLQEGGKYCLVSNGVINQEITIDPSAKEDFKKMMSWTEGQWKFNTCKRFI